MANRSERIYRALLAAVAGSGLTTREIRWLVEELSSRGELTYKIQEGLWRLADDLEGKFGRSSSSAYSNSSAYEFGHLAELIYDQVVSKRMTKGELRSVLSQLDNKHDWMNESSRFTTRVMIEQFVEDAKPGAVSRLMGILGMESEDDSFLAGIDRKAKGL